jgi:SOS-response transcriptional repressor LexA
MLSFENMSVGKNIKEARKRAGLSQESLAGFVGVSPATISQWENDITKPDGENLLKCAARLGEDPFKLQFGKSEDYFISKANISSNTKIPIISWSDIDKWEMIKHDLNENQEYVLLDAKNSDCYALIVHGDSMESPTKNPSFPEGNVIIISQQKEIKAGKFVIARLKDTGKITFRQFIKEPFGTFLKPLNPAYPIIDIEKTGFDLLGVVVASMTLDL